MQKFISYLKAHITGQHTLVRTFWINSVLGYILLLLLVALIGWVYPNVYLIISLMLLFFIWALVGTILKCLKTISNQDRKSSLFEKLHATMLLVLSIFIVFYLYRDIYLP